MKHTQGEWKIAYYEEDELNPCICVDGFTVASLDQGYYQDPLPQRQIDANARLIASAPEMLDILKSILELGKRDLTNPKYDSYFVTMKEIIKKAEGIL